FLIAWTHDTSFTIAVGGVDEIEASWRAWQQSMTLGIEHDDVPVFWEPIRRAAGSVNNIRHFIIIPDGIYFNANPAILLVEPTGRVRVDVVIDFHAYLFKRVPANIAGDACVI